VDELALAQKNLRFNELNDPPAILKSILQDVENRIRTARKTFRRFPDKRAAPAKRQLADILA
jgi:hypothetical protein